MVKLAKKLDSLTFGFSLRTIKHQISFPTLLLSPLESQIHDFTECLYTHICFSPGIASFYHRKSDYNLNKLLQKNMLKCSLITFCFHSACEVKKRVHEKLQIPAEHDEWKETNLSIGLSISKWGEKRNNKIE